MRVYLSYFIKGMAIGIANAIPGVSGGTIAFVLGIYEKLTYSISTLPTALIKLKWKDIIESLKSEKVYSDWVDAGGLICAKERLDNIIKYIENEKINNIESILNAFKSLYDNYYPDEKSWVIDIIKKRYYIKNIDKEIIIKILKEYISLLKTSYDILYRDAEKEYDISKMVSCGIDDKNFMEEDFKAIRGTVKDNAFVIQYKKDMNSKINDINKIIDLL